MKKFKLLAVGIAIVMMFTMSVSATQTYLYTFDDDNVGDNMSFTAMGDEWGERVGNPMSYPVVQEAENGNILGLIGFTEVHSSNITDEYVFSVDVKPSDEVSTSGLGGIFVRCVNAENFTIAQWPAPIYGFESDQYAENKGTQGQGGVGSSGIYVVPMRDGLKLAVKKYVTDSTTISNEVFMLDYPEGVDYKQFMNVKFRDNGEKVEILLNNTSLAVVELYNPGVAYESDNNTMGDQYFGKAIVKGADGSVLGEIENTRVSSLYSIISLSSRSFTIWTDNVKLITGDGAIVEDGGKADEPDNDETEAPATDAATDAPTKDTNAATNAVTNAADTTTASGDISDGGLSPVVIVIIVVAVIAVAAVAVVIFKKKK